MSRSDSLNNRAIKLNRSTSDTLKQERPAAKRQRVDSSTSYPTDTEDDACMAISYDPLKNGGLKGRKRFAADFADLKSACSEGYVTSDLRLKRVIPGDDEGSVEINIEDAKGEPVLNATLLISDTSEYPGSHSLFCYSPDGDLSAKIQRIVDELPEQPPSTIGETVQKIMASIARTMMSKPPISKPQAESEEEEDDGDDFDAFDAFDYDDIGTIAVEPEAVMSTLQQNFLDIVATEYRPGFIRLGGNDFVVSTSLPVVKLAQSVPPRALMAWDRRLLSCTQHLTLLISGFRGHYPVLETDASYTVNAQRLGVALSFKVGLSHRYKPGREQVQELVRKHGLILQDAEDEVRIQKELAAERARRESEWDPDSMEDYPDELVIEETPVPVVDEGRFDRFSLSSSLESLMDQSFLKIVQLRRKFGLGWSGAEVLLTEIEKSQAKDEEVYRKKESIVTEADRNESKLSRTTTLPHDPLLGLDPTEPFNLPLTAFCYLIRRLSLCTRYCIVCHNELHFDYESLKPYVCDSKLCSYQYYSLNRGPSLEYEIVHNPLTVDLLVSLAYSAASEGAMEDPLPVGMGLRVPPPINPILPPVPFPLHPQHAPRQPPATLNEFALGEDGLCDFDSLEVSQMRSAIQSLIASLPSVEDMKRHLGRKVEAGKSKPKLKDVDPTVLPAAWSILRWCVASCTAHIEAITEPEEMVKGFDTTFVQFKMTVGAPDAEAKFNDAIKAAKAKDANAATYPVIYAFHGSPLRNWHSIIRHGLWYKVVAHGRAFGDGVYLAKDAATSMGGYASHGRATWTRSSISPTNCMALAEVVNLPEEFVSSNPHYVIKDTHWIMCRYLLVKGMSADMLDQNTGKPRPPEKSTNVPVVRMDPMHKTAVSGKALEIPDPEYQIQNLLASRQKEVVTEDPDEEDMSIFNLDERQKDIGSESMELDEDYLVPVRKPARDPVVRQSDDWQHDSGWVSKTIESLMLPPFESSPTASVAIQRELRAMLKEQEAAPSLRDLGWYIPPELIGDNLYQWIVEMHSLDPALPIAKDMKKHELNSIIFEIRFPPTFPIAPPFFRIITPRFLPFIQGGGGHVTGGGSICMDLLTSDGWLPSYSISAVLMQIRLALSNLEPRPARLAANWERPYDIHESLAGYKRAAATHNWKLPPGLDRLVR